MSQISASVTSTNCLSGQPPMDTVPAMEVPDSVTAALARAESLGYELSSEPEIGELIACFAHAVPSGGRVLEIGTGSGVGLAWIVHGIGPRTDMEVVSAERNAGIAGHTQQAGWPEWVSMLVGDGAHLVGTIGSFDLIVPDAPEGRSFWLRKTFSTLRPGDSSWWMTWVYQLMTMPNFGMPLLP